MELYAGQGDFDPRTRRRISLFAGQHLSGQLEAWLSKAVGEQSVVADAHEAFGQDVEEGAAQELCGIDTHGALLVAVGRVSPAEGGMFAVEAEQALIGDSWRTGAPNPPPENHAVTVLLARLT